MNFSIFSLSDLSAVILLPESNAAKVLSDFELIRSNKEYPSFSFVNNRLLEPLVSLKIHREEIEELAKDFFPERSFLLNEESLLCLMEDYGGYLEYPMGEYSRICFIYNSEQIVTHVFLSIANKTIGVLPEFLEALSKKYSLILVDYITQFSASIGTPVLREYLMKMFDGEDTEEPAEISTKTKQSGWWNIGLFGKIYIALSIGFLVVNGLGVIYLFTKQFPLIGSWMLLLVWLFFLHRYNLGRAIAKDDGVVLYIKFRKQLIEYKDIVYLIVAENKIRLWVYLDNTFFSCALFINNDRDIHFFSKIFNGVYRNRQRFTSQRLQDILSKKEVKNQLAKDFIHSQILSWYFWFWYVRKKCFLYFWSYANLFSTAFNSSETIYFDGYRCQVINFLHKIPDSSSGYPKIVSTDWRELQVAGNVWSQSLLVDKRGGIWGLVGTGLMYFGKDFFQAFPNMLTANRPSSVQKLLPQYPSMISRCFISWNIAYTYQKLLPLQDEFRKSFGIPKKIPLLPILIRHGDYTSLVSYNLTDKTFYYFKKKTDDEKDAHFEIVDSSQKLDKLLSPSYAQLGLLVPKESIDLVIPKCISALGVEMSEWEWREKMTTISPDIQRLVNTSEQVEAASTDVYYFNGNSDWIRLIVSCTILKSDEMFQIFNHFHERFSEVYGKVAYSNFFDYSLAFVNSFNTPKVQLSPLFPYLKESLSAKLTGEYEQFTLTMNSNYAPDFILDITSILQIPFSPLYMQEVLLNDGISWLHCIWIFTHDNPENSSFVVADCQNIDRLYGVVIRADVALSSIIQKRLTEWDNFFRLMKGVPYRNSPIPDDIEEENNYLSKLVQDLHITESDIYSNNKEDQFVHTNTFRHKVKRLLFKVKIILLRLF